MKLNDVLKEATRDDAWWVDDAIDSAWDSDYTLFYEEIGGMVKELADMYPDNPSAVKAQRYFMKQFAGLDGAKVAEHEYPDKLIAYVLGTDYRSGDMPFKEAVKRLRRFEKWVDDVNVFYEAGDIEDREHSEGKFDYKGPSNPYDDAGMKPSDF